MNATSIQYQITKLTEAVKEVHATWALTNEPGCYVVSRGETCCKATPTEDSIIIDCAQGVITVTRDSAPNIRTALNIALVRPLLDRVCADTCWVIKPHRRSDCWEIVDSQDKEATVEVAMGGCYTEPEICIGGSKREVRVLTVANLKKHITKAMAKARQNAQWHRENKANAAEEKDVKALLKKGINDGGVVSTEQRDIRFGDGWREIEGTAGGTWKVTLDYKRQGLIAQVVIETSLQHAYAAGLILAKRLENLDKI